MSTFDLNYWKELDKKIPGWMSEEEARFLVENTKKDGDYLEIGTAYGKSFSVMAHHFPKKERLTIDLIDHGNREKFSEDKKAHVHLGDSISYSTTSGWNIGTLLIDGDHTYEGALRDFLYWFPKVQEGGRIIFHDYNRDKNHEGVTQAVDAIKPMLTEHSVARCIWAGTKPKVNKLNHSI